jgi:hypothetical protein
VFKFCDPSGSLVLKIHGAVVVGMYRHFQFFFTTKEQGDKCAWLTIPARFQ